MNRFAALVITLAASRVQGSLFAQESDNLFERLDTNKDRVLTADEVPEDQQRFFERLVQVADADKDGTVSLEEYQKSWEQGPSDHSEDRRFGPGRPEFGRGPNPFDGGELLKRADANGDGKITIDEVPERLRERMQSIFNRLGKEELTVEELRPFSSNRGPSTSRFGERPQFTRPDGDRPRGFGGSESGRPIFGGQIALMRILDADGNGSISKAEALEVSKLFHELDANKDGELDARELFGFARSRSEGSGARPDGPGRPDFGSRDRFGDPRGDFRTERTRPENSRPERSRRPEGNPPVGGGGGLSPQSFINRFDTDQDGMVSKEEAPERIAEQFDKLDTDKNGQLTKEEFDVLFRVPARPQPGSDRPASENSAAAEKPEDTKTATPEKKD